MTGFCGWNGYFSGHDPGLILERMSQGIFSVEHFPDQVIGKNAAICVVGKTASHFSHAGVHVVLDGHPYWSNSQLENISQLEGPARALFETYQRYGSALLEYIFGSFALAIIDERNDQTIIAVDRMGTKPLNYCLVNNKTLVFGSSAQAVRYHEIVNATISEQAIYDYIYFHVIPSPETIYREIRKLEPAECLIYHNEHIDIKRYWIPVFNEMTSPPFAVLQDQLMTSLRSAIQRCQPDDTTGAFLSGGTDSSTVSGLLQELREDPLPVYSIGFSSPGYDEIEFAKIAARHFGLDLREHYISPQEVVDAIPLVARAYDEPFGNSSAIPTLICARVARSQGTTALLAGDGGDELFAGNERYAKQKVFDAYRHIPNWLHVHILKRFFQDFPASQIFMPSRKLGRYIEQATIPMPDRMESYNFLHRIAPSSIFEPDFLSSINIRHPADMLSSSYKTAPCNTILNKMLFLDWKITLADNDLRKVGRMCELEGIDVLYPFLDDDVVTFANQIPPSLKLRRLKLRYFFKRALRDFLPTEILTKSKHGFGLPFGEWLKTSPLLQDSIYSNLEDLKKRKIVKADFIDEIIETHRTDHAAYYGTMVWILAMLEQWFCEHHSSQ